jgi:hypothetical protein
MRERKRTAMTATRDFLINHARRVRAGEISYKKAWVTPEQIAYLEGYRPDTIYRELKRMTAFGFADIHTRSDYVVTNNGRLKQYGKPYYRLSPTFLNQLAWALAGADK